MNENLGYNTDQVADDVHTEIYAKRQLLGFETTSKRFPYYPFAEFLEEGLKIPFMCLAIWSNCDESINQFDRYCDQSINQF